MMGLNGAGYLQLDEEPAVALLSGRKKSEDLVRELEFGMEMAEDGYREEVYDEAMDGDIGGLADDRETLWNAYDKLIKLIQRWK